MRILITDHHCSSNRGDAAILEGMISSLKKEFPDAVFSVASDYPDGTKVFHDVDSFVQPFTSFQWQVVAVVKMMYFLLAAWCYRKMKVNLPRFNSVWIKHYKNADIVISKGGGFLNDFYYPGIIGRFWGLLFAKVLGKRVVLYAQSVGPIYRWITGRIAKFVFDRVDLILLRDKQSLNILKNIRVVNPNVYVTADAAFCMDLSRTGENQIAKYRLETKKEIVVDDKNPKISISVRKWRFFKTSNGYEMYLDKIAELVVWLVEVKKVFVIFASTCTNFYNYHHDDRLVALDIINRVKNINGKSLRRVKLLLGEYTPYELSEFYSTVDLHIGTRMHSNILALIVGTPILAIGYEFKTKGLLEQIGMEEFFVDINEMRLEEVKAKIEYILENRMDVKKKIQTNVAALKRRAKQNVLWIKKLLDGNL